MIEARQSEQQEEERKRREEEERKREINERALNARNIERNLAAIKNQ